MRIYSLSKLLILPLALIGIGILAYGEYIGHRNDTVWVILPGILLALDLLFAPQIDFWWQSKYPIPLDEAVKSWLNRHSVYYRSIKGADKIKYESRLSLYMEGREYKSVGQEIREVPDDLKGIVGSIPIMLTMHQDDFLLGDYDRIYFYKHPFPTPDRQYLHCVEVNHEDGVLLFSLEHLLPGFTRPESFYPIGLHAFLEAYDKQYTPDFPSLPDWEAITMVSGYQEKEVENITGLPDLNFRIITAICYFIFPQELNDNFPEVFNAFYSIFKIPLPDQID